MRKTLTLFELNALVRETIETTLTQEYWVEAELSEAREVRGHCYMQLIQKNPFNNTPVAQADAKCWKSVWLQVRTRFEKVTGQRFHAGLKVLLKVYAQFHENYGFSWIVTDIDPTYTMGDMARKRQEIVRQLKASGVFDNQKELSLPMFCQRVAVVSSANAAGYGDFVNQLEQNKWGFRFHTQLFPAIMQGEQVEQSVIAALDAIWQQAEAPDASDFAFDCVVIIRGGGAVADLSGFDTLALAENVANFPLPVITGIGHDRDESVLDMVSHVRVKTPTAAAAFLIDHLQQVYDRLLDAQETIVSAVSHRMELERLRLQRLQGQLPMLFSLVKTRKEAQQDRLLSALLSSMQHRLDREQSRMEQLGSSLQPLLSRRLTAESHRLQLLEQRACSLDPERLLKRGYTITTTPDGRVVRKPSDVAPGDEIVTRLEQGAIRSKVSSAT